MNGYGSHTFKNVNERGEAVYVKYHFKTDQGVKNLMADEADKLASTDPDYAQRDLYNAIAEGNFPSWTLYIQVRRNVCSNANVVSELPTIYDLLTTTHYLLPGWLLSQVMTFANAESFRWNPFDLTKIWPHKEFPLIEVGRMVLNRNPQNYFAEVEQIAFAPSHMVPGIEPSPDKMLQGRLFSYNDTHRHRLGANYQQIPINRPFNTKVRNYQRDGPACVDGNQVSMVTA